VPTLHSCCLWVQFQALHSVQAKIRHQQGLIKANSCSAPALLRLCYSSRFVQPPEDAYSLLTFDSGVFHVQVRIQGFIGSIFPHKFSARHARLRLALLNKNPYSNSAPMFLRKFYAPQIFGGKKELGLNCVKPFFFLDPQKYHPKSTMPPC
jgi:hypothetical protein